MTAHGASADDAQSIVAAIDHAIGRLATDVTRLDSIDLDAPWMASAPSRRDRLSALIEELDADALPSFIEHGHEASSALVQAWSAHRDASSGGDLERQQRLLSTVHDTHVALDVGVRPVDLP